MKKNILITIFITIAGILVIAGLFGLASQIRKNTVKTEEPLCAKPVIYLYPEAPMDVTVQLDYHGTLDVTYPDYNDLWHVHAQPDGTLYNYADGREYSYLFWEGHGEHQYDLSQGFVVSGGDTAEFLQEKLAEIGLTPREYNEMIVYWLPQLQNNPYNQISFQFDAYTKDAPLTIQPKPDSLLRVFIACKALDRPINLLAQVLPPFERKGFTVVEWGGAIVK